MKIIEKFDNSSEIVIVRTDKIGDMVLTLPLARALKEYNPNLCVSIVANSVNEPLLKNLYVDKYFLVDKLNGIDNVFKNNQFDVAFFPMPKFDEAFSAFKNRIPLRIGSAYRFYSIFFNHKIYDHRKISEYHEADYNLRMFESIIKSKHNPKPVIPIISDNVSLDINNLITKYNPKNKKTMIIHPGSRGSSLDIPISKLDELIKRLSKFEELLIFITGTGQDKDICSLLSNNANTVNLYELLSLEQLIELIRRSDLLVANSTGVLHIAASMQIPVLTFFPNTPSMSSKRWGPLWTKSHIFSPEPITLSGKYNDDMSSISVDDVYNIAIEMLDY
ncbi:glycosyltransferase family 9 protein [Candidatus Kapaibacterium sp.]